MRIAAGVLTWNPVKTGRLELLEQTVESLETAGIPTTVFDNGSTDEYDRPGLVRFPRIPGYPSAHSCGYGMNKIAATLHGQADIIILSNDDIVWAQDTAQTLDEVWTEAPDNLAIVSGLVEPTFAQPGVEAWNLPYEVVELAGHKLLGRKSVPGGAWTYRDSHYPLIFPVSTFPGFDDVPACHMLALKGYGVACLDLAEHVGIGRSTWGNASHDRFIIEPVQDVKTRFGL